MLSRGLRKGAMKRILLIITVAQASAFAHADGLVASIGYGGRAETKGVEVEIGYRKTFAAAALNIMPFTGILYSDPDTRYREETFSNGTTVCRDTSNGQFSDKDKCSKNSFAYAFIASVDYPVNDKLALGAGVRVADEADLFVTFRASLTGRTTLHAKAGGQYVSAGFAYGF